MKITFVSESQLAIRNVNKNKTSTLPNYAPTYTYDTIQEMEDTDLQKVANSIITYDQTEDKWKTTRAPFDICISIDGYFDGAGEVLWSAILPRTIEFTNNMSGSTGIITETPPTSDYSYSINIDGTLIGNATAHPNGYFSFSGSGVAPAGSLLSFKDSNVNDPAISGISVVLSGVRK